MTDAQSKELGSLIYKVKDARSKRRKAVKAKTVAIFEAEAAQTDLVIATERLNHFVNELCEPLTL